MRILRMMVRLPALLLVQGAGFITALFLRTAFAGNRKRHWKWLTWCIRLWARASCACLNIRIRVEGDRCIPPGSLVVSNHMGSPDIFILASCFETFFVSKADVRGWPVVGKMVEWGGAVFIDRKQRRQITNMVKQVSHRLRDGFHVVLYPEGGATRGDSVYPFMSSVFEAAVQEGRPVIPVLIRYYDGQTPSIACWADIGFVQHMVRLLTFPRLEATVCILPPIECVVDRQKLAQLSHDAVFEKYLESLSESEKAQAEALSVAGLEKHWD